jgi:ATP-dependent helicase HrpA
VSGSLKKAISDCALADRHLLRGLLSKIDRLESGSQDYRLGLAELEKRIRNSRAEVQARADNIPAEISLPDSLPVSERAEEIVELIKGHQVVVVAGETGSGKTTQLPKLCLRAGLGRFGMIGHTQPRRLAAVSVASRIAEELRSEPGQGVGYQIRFSDQTVKNTYLKLMTDGILLNEIQQDRFLNNYDALIIDEAHERSLNIDFILGYLKQLLSRRPDLKVIITSATIDVDKFATHFEGAPVVSVSGRTYPVEIRYAPPAVGKDAVFDDDVQIESILSALRDIEQLDRARTGPGDVLVFFSSEKEIRETALAIRKQRFKNLEVLPLYARLRQADQLKIFQPHKGRRVILATNIAETSLTVPGIRYVIDTGLARISRYSIQSKIQRLPIERISQASARQRAGRCGRIAEGVCIRLYSEQDFNSRPEFTDPEIKRTNLAAVILQMLALKLGEVSDFPFLDVPETKAINDGFKLLFELGAIDERRHLTSTGRMMARLPVDPRFARMLIAGAKNACLHELAIIVGALSIQDPRETPADKRQAAREKHSVFDHAESDFLSLVNLWNAYENSRQELTHSQLRKYCNTNFLSYSRMREWRETHRQLLTLCHQLRLKLSNSEAAYRDVHTALLSGSLNQLGCRVEGTEYLGSRNRKFRLLPVSTLAARPPKWIVSGTVFETRQAYSSAAARIDPEWVESVAGHLLRREWFEPHWSKKRQRVMAYEKISLYGLAIIEKRAVPYDDVDPGVCRELFIRQGLVDQQLQVDLPFYRHNAQLRETLEKQDEKLRKQAVFMDERRLEDFYEARIPDWVIDRASLLRWYGKAARRKPELLQMRLEDLLPEHSSQRLQRDFPDRATLHNNPLQVEYQFQPGTDGDGATIEVPAPLLDQLSARDLDWVIPGQIRERSIQLLKTLPKSTRKRLIPIPDFVDRALADVEPERMEQDLASVLVEQARRLKGVQISRDLLAVDKIPEYLKVKIKVVDESGKVLDSDADLDQLRRRLSSNKQVRAAIRRESQTAGHPLEMSGLTDWLLDQLPEQVEVGQQLKLLRFPALIDETETVAVKLLADRLEAQCQTRRGLVRLLRLRTRQQSAELNKQFTRRQRDWGLQLPPFLAGKEIAEAFVFAVYCEVFQLRDSLPRDQAAFEKRLLDCKAGLFETASQLTAVLDKLITRHFGLLRRLNTSVDDATRIDSDVHSQLNALFSEGFLYSVPFEWLREYPRYLQAIEHRLERAKGHAARDLELFEELQSQWQRLTGTVQPESVTLNAFVEDRPMLLKYRWMIEEFRVSLFAQQLRTRLPVSAKRLERLWESQVGDTEKTI